MSCCGNIDNIAEGRDVLSYRDLPVLVASPLFPSLGLLLIKCLFEVQRWSTFFQGKFIGRIGFAKFIFYCVLEIPPCVFLLSVHLQPGGSISLHWLYYPQGTANAVMFQCLNNREWIDTISLLSLAFFLSLCDISPTHTHRILFLSYRQWLWAIKVKAIIINILVKLHSIIFLFSHIGLSHNYSCRRCFC